jgi:hypothetical protein
MSYFAAFPVINFSLDGGITSFPMTDIFRRVRALDSNLSNTSLYDPYDVRDGETPEIVADKFYNNPKFHWIVLVANEILDPRFDWPLPELQLKAYIRNKYNITNVDAIRHYENNLGDIVYNADGDPAKDYPGTTYPVSYYDYENDINEAKRKIRLIKAQYIPAFVKNFQSLLKTNGQ